MKTLFQTLCDLDASNDLALNSVINIFAVEHGLDANYDRDDILALIAETTNQVEAANAYNIVATGSCGVPSDIVDINTTMPLGKLFMN
jgi:hypothetical protein|tara:strand:- start:74 stop:337 length:264 start_codon:yes stop_codon:yes gene_type:complete